MKLHDAHSMFDESGEFNARSGILSLFFQVNITLFCSDAYLDLTLRFTFTQQLE